MKAPWPWLVVLCAALGACGRTSSTASVRSDASGASSALRPAPAPSALTRVEPACAAVTPTETIGNGQGRASEDGFVALENLRVLASEATFVVTWERQSRFAMGDSWRSPYAAVRHGDAAFRVVEFPVDAYACATSGFIAPSTLAEAVTWGVANARGFEFWPKLPRAIEDEAGNVRVTPSSARTLLTRKQEVGAFVMSGSVALAMTMEGECDIACTCAGNWKPALWVYGLDPKRRFSQRIAIASTTAPPAPDNDVPNAPALAFGEHGGAAAFRSGRALYLSWLNSSGKPQGTPLRFDEGDVGAPALALAGRDLIVVWARRESKAAPHRLRSLRLAPLATPGAARELATRGSALAPAVIADDRSMVVAWMEGDPDRRGAILVARAKLDDHELVGRVISRAEETNARDPELSGTVGEPALVYGSFSKTHPGGEVRFARLRCSEL